MLTNESGSENIKSKERSSVQSDSFLKTLKGGYMEERRKSVENHDSKIQSLENAVKFLQKELDGEYTKKIAGLKYGIEKGRAVFQQEVLKRHRELKIGLWKYMRSASFLVIITAPVIYFGIIPVIIMDVFVTVYQWICFPVYKIPRVKRSDYFIYERTHLAYLNLIQMINCAYCSYGNGVIAYSREIFARTEQHWCPIKHAKKVLGYHDLYNEFAEFGDAEDFAKKYISERKADKNPSNT